MKIQILKLKDNTDKFTMKKNKTFDIPFRLLIVGKTGMGKSNILASMLLQDNKEFYRNDFEGDRIFIFTGSPSDNKLKIIRKELDIPDENVFKGYDEEAIEVIYDMMVEEYNEAIEEKYPDKNIFYDFDYCKYSDWGYKKRTRFWTNITDITSKKCKMDCDNIISANEKGEVEQRIHKRSVNNNLTARIEVDGKLITCNSAELRKKYRKQLDEQSAKRKLYNKDQKCIGAGTSRLERYRIPAKLIDELLSKCQ